MKSLFGLIALLGLSSAYAGSAALICSPPAKNTDGSTITGAITYNFYRGTSATAVTTKLNATPTTACAYTDAAAPVGTVYYAATAIVAGQESALSAVVSKVIAAPIPNPPSSLTVTDAGVAYKLRQAVNSLSMIRIGKVAPGTSCDVSHSVDGYYLVPRSTVILDSKVDTLPLIVFSECSA